MDIKYELFAPSGRPLRATANCTFKEHSSSLLDALLSAFSSPDLTHVREVKAGETLPLIANEIYGDPALYTEIARVNGLKNFRDIRPGQQLILPPIDKATASRS
jgi:nucleoid-associated protein YgaU